jgi:glycosyltransferase involved in cell wall biosynthesis
VYKDHCIAVVVPAYNEERFIDQVILTMPDFVDHVIVVDDCSKDATSEVAAGTKEPRLSLLSTGVNQGVGGATMTGYKKALELGADIMVKMDGDGQMIPEYLCQLLDALIDDGVAYAKGNRFLMTEYLPSMPRHRLLGNIVLTFMTKLASGYWHVFDPQNGFTAVRAETLRQVDLSTVAKRYFFENDMLVHLNVLAARVRDVAMPAKYGDESSHMNIMNVMVTFPLFLLRRFFQRINQRYVIRDFSPIALFFYSGLTLFLIGFLFGAYLLASIPSRVAPAPTGTIVIALLPLILGFQLLLQALVLDIQESPR